MQFLRLQKWVTNKQFSALTVAGVTGIIGVLLLTLSQAATPTASLETENGVINDPASIVTDNNASGGRAVLFAAAKPLFGVLQATSGNATSDVGAGVKVAVLGLGWNSYEPQDGSFSSSYIESVQAKLQAFRAAGLKVVLDFGEQYPPAWLLGEPNSRYVDQYGDGYTNPSNPGKNVANLVFNQAMRNAYQAYIQRVFNDLGTDFYYVRAGGGWYGELNYPDTSFNGHTNAYWGFDSIALGQTGTLPSGMTPNPVPSWLPGTASADHASASQFMNWYLSSLKNYHDWQITTIRQSYSGSIAMLYPSSGGLRPGQLNAAINDDLNGSTSAEVNGEVQRGFDFSRYIAGITDPKVIVYTTWLDAQWSGQNDSSTDQSLWSPVHNLAYLAAQNPLHLSVSGENSGHNSYTQLQLCFSRAKQYGLTGFMWAFEPDLYSGNDAYASLSQYQSLISQQ